MTNTYKKTQKTPPNSRTHMVHVTNKQEIMRVSIIEDEENENCSESHVGVIYKRWDFWSFTRFMCNGKIKVGL